MSLLGRVGATDPRTRRRRRPSRLASRPQTLPIVATVLAWAVLVVSHSAVTGSDHSGASDAAHGSVFTPAGIGHVAAMTVAMMATFALSGVRTAAFNSLWWRAGRAAAVFLTAFLLTWTVIALCLAAVATAWTTWLGSATIGTAALLAVCALAQLDPTRPERAKRCDRPMRLRAGGPDADVDCARYGVSTACRHVRFCALPMLAMLALPGHLLMMAAVTVLALADRVTDGRRRLVIAAAYTALAVALLLSWR